MKACDLHTHSVWSDGTWTPEQLLEEAQRIGLSAIALTDHNTVAGLPDFMAAARGKTVQAIPGIEFSTDHNGTELHILGLFIRREHYGAITQLLEEAQLQKRQSNRDLICNLNRAGFGLDYDRIAHSCKNGLFNRAHVASEMVRLGYASSREDAFRRFLAPARGFYHPPKRITALECIRCIRSMGAVSVLAHPFLNLSEEELETFLPDAVACGLDAMETVYVSYDEQTTQKAMDMANRFGLAHSGGSDFHGDNKQGIFLGVGRGNLEIPGDFLEKLQKILVQR